MDFRFPAEAEAFRQEVREFLEEHVTPEYLEERRATANDNDGPGPETRKFMQALFKRGFLTMNWPEEYGGQARTFLERAVFSEEFAKAGAATSATGAVGLNIVAPALMQYGSEEQKRSVLPKIASGEWIFCQLFTEPGAGSDLASLVTAAIRDGDDYVVNGSKIFTSWGHLATHGYLLARTDPTAERHRGLSLFVLEMKTPGVEVRPLMLANGTRHNMVFFDDVRVSASKMLGEENRGWYHAMVSFDFERSGSVGTNVEREREIATLLDYARETTRRGKQLSKHPAIRNALVQAYRDMRISRALGLRILDTYNNKRVPSVESSEYNLHGKQSGGRIAEIWGLVYGSYGQLNRDTHRSIEDGARSWWQLAGRHAAGSQEIQKNIIAQRGLGMPR
jgi:alkylation response protein AidB-like acyl-CoA dehydrogenase